MPPILSSTEQAKWMETMMNMSWEATKQVYGWVVENYDGAYKEKVTFYPSVFGIFGSNRSFSSD